MNLTEYTYLLNNPDTINERRTDELDKIISEFPYFQSARALRLKGLYNEDSFRYNYALKVAAAYTADRSVLFDFITSDRFTSVQKEFHEARQHELHEIAVSESVEITDEAETEPEVAVGTEFATEDEPAEIGQTEQLAQMAEVETEEADIEPTSVEIPEEPQIEKPASYLPEVDAVTKSVLDSIKEAEQYAKSIDVEDAVQIKAPVRVEPEPEPIRKTETPEANLEIGKPLDFSANEKHSFHEWLQLSSFQPIVRDSQPEAETHEPIEESDETADEESGRQKKNELIDRFIETNPKIPPIKPETPSPAFIFEPSQPDNSFLMTETLARVYLEQRKYEKAIQAYEILILKYPEKSSFFADRILDIRNLQQNNRL